MNEWGDMPPVGVEFGAPVLSAASLEKLFRKNPGEVRAYLGNLVATYDQEKLVALVLNLSDVCASFAVKASSSEDEGQGRK